MFAVDDRVVMAYENTLPDGAGPIGTVVKTIEDGEDTLYRVRWDGHYFVNVSECVGGTNPAAQYAQWYMKEDLVCVPDNA